MRYVLGFAFLLLGFIPNSSGQTPAAPPSVTLPATIWAPVGETFSLTIPFDGAALQVFGSKFPDRKLNVIREMSDDPKSANVVLWSMSPGVFELRAVCCRGDKLSPPAVALVTIGGNPPGPPNPPGPNPPGPNPPGPNPPGPPVPNDPLVQSVKESFDRDSQTDGKPDPAKRISNIEHKLRLAGFYRSAAKHARNESIKTVGDLKDDIEATLNDPSNPFIPEGAIPETRKAVGLRFAAVAGTDLTRQISPDLRDKIIAVLELIATILSLFS